MPHARVADHELYYERAGAGEPLLLVMGMSGSHLSWGEPFLSELRRDFDVVAYDHRGIGRSDRLRGAFELADLADDAAGLMDVLGWASAHVVGISMGGMVAQEMALRHADRVRTLVLGCTYAGGPGARLTPNEVWSELAAAMTSGDRERALRAGWAVNVSERFARREDRYAAYRRQALEAPARLDVIMSQVRAIGRHDTSERLERIAAPTLVVHGTEDRMLPVSNAEPIARRIPDARLEVLDEIGHLFFWELPERSAQLVREHALGDRALAS